MDDTALPPISEHITICGWGITITAPVGCNNIFFVPSIQIKLVQQTKDGQFGYATLCFREDECCDD